MLYVADLSVEKSDQNDRKYLKSEQMLDRKRVRVTNYAMKVLFLVLNENGGNNDLWMIMWLSFKFNSTFKLWIQFDIFILLDPFMFYFCDSHMNEWVLFYNLCVCDIVSKLFEHIENITRRNKIYSGHSNVCLIYQMNIKEIKKKTKQNKWTTTYIKMH